MRRALFVGVCVFATMFCFAGTARAISPEVVEGPIYDPNTGMDLYVLGPWTFFPLQAEAVALGGNLDTIVSAADNTFIVNNILQDFTSSGGPNLSDVSLFIGLYDPTGIAADDGPGGPGSQHAANFVWVDGSTATYRDWGPGEPNDQIVSPGVGEYTTLFNWPYVVGYGPEGSWNDVEVAAGLEYGLMEAAPAAPATGVPEPATMTLLGLGLAGLMAKVARRKKSVVRRYVMLQREMDKCLTLVRDFGPSEVCAVSRSWGSAPDPGVLRGIRGL